uniref:Uncharacterized protein n=1 Tax=Meloidogyne incognita TaxID=6306 RepID=A0A914M984_MELIC
MGCRADIEVYNEGLRTELKRCPQMSLFCNVLKCRFRYNVRKCRFLCNVRKCRFLSSDLKIVSYNGVFIMRGILNWRYLLVDFQ